MLKEKVNIAFLDLAIDMFGGDDDDAYQYYKGLNLQTEEDYKKIIRKEVVPYFNNQLERIRDEIKKTLSYSLNIEGFNFKNVFYSIMPSFDIPENDDCRPFFLWIWEELFGTEDFLITNITDYEEICDYEEIGRMNEIIKEYGEYTEENILKKYKMKDGKWVRLKK